MPTRRLRKHFLKRIANEIRAVGEVGLAFLMTAGVASCGGETVGAGDSGTHPTDDGSSKADRSISPEGVVVDGPAMEGATFDGGIVEAASCEGGCFVEAAMVEGGIVVDGPCCPDGPAMVDGGVVIDGPPPPYDGGPVTEGAQFVEGGVIDGMGIHEGGGH